LTASSLNVVVMGINFLFKIFLSYTISKNAIGVFYTFMDIVALGIMFFSGFRDTLIKAYDGYDFKKIFFWYSLFFWSGSGVVALLESMFFMESFKIFDVMDFFILFFLNTLVVYLSYLNAAYKNYKVMLFENLVAVFGVIGGYVLFSLLTERMEALLFGFMTGYIVRSGFILLYGKIDFDFEIGRYSEAKSFLKNSILASLMYFFSGLFINSASFVILELFGDHSFLGDFQVVIRSIFFSLITIFVFPLNTFLFPEISKLISNNSLDEVKAIEKRLQIYLLLLFFILMAAIFLTEPILNFIFPQTYGSSYIYLNLLLPMLVFIAYTTFNLNIIKGFNRFDWALYVRMAGSGLFFISAGFMYLLEMDASAVIYAFDISFFSMFLFSFHYKKRLLLS